MGAQCHLVGLASDQIRPNDIEVSIFAKNVTWSGLCEAPSSNETGDGFSSHLGTKTRLGSVDEEDGKPILPPRGVERSEMDDVLKRLHDLCHLIEPLYQPIVEPVQMDGAWLVVIWVPGGYGRPYKVTKDVLAKDKSNKRYYIRKFSSTVIASPDEERELFYASQTIPFDDQPNLAAVEDLSRPLLREHLHKVGSSLYGISENLETKEIARSMRLLAGPPEDLRPRNVGILMFNERVDDFFPTLA